MLNTDWSDLGSWKEILNISLELEKNILIKKILLNHGVNLQIFIKAKTF